VVIGIRADFALFTSRCRDGHHAEILAMLPPLIDIGMTRLPVVECMVVSLSSLWNGFGKITQSFLDFRGVSGPSVMHTSRCSLDHAVCFLPMSPSSLWSDVKHHQGRFTGRLGLQHH